MIGRLDSASVMVSNRESGVREMVERIMWPPGWIHMSKTWLVVKHKQSSGVAMNLVGPITKEKKKLPW